MPRGVRSAWCKVSHDTGSALFLAKSSRYLIIARSAAARALHLQTPAAPNRGMMRMFKHLLIPTDGSELSEAAIQAGVQFAKSINAKVTGFYAMPMFNMLVHGPAGRIEDFVKDSKAHAERFLAVIMQAAKAADVPCETALQTSDQPYQAIIATAKEKGCDLI